MEELQFDRGFAEKFHKKVREVTFRYLDEKGVSYSSNDVCFDQFNGSRDFNLEATLYQAPCYLHLDIELSPSSLNSEGKASYRIRSGCDLQIDAKEEGLVVRGPDGRNQIFPKYDLEILVGKIVLLHRKKEWMWG